MCSGDYQVLDFGLGVFSVEIEELYGVRYALESPMSDMPGGIPLCHFVSSLYQLDENLNWDEKQGNYRFFLRDADVSEEFLAISEKLNILLPRFIKTFSSVEKLVECHQRRIGAWWMSTQSKLYAATGCIILGRYDEAEKLIESAIKLGSAPIMKETAVRFRAIIRERRASPN